MHDDLWQAREREGEWGREFFLPQIKVLIFLPQNAHAPVFLSSVFLFFSVMIEFSEQLTQRRKRILNMQRQKASVFSPNTAKKIRRKHSNRERGREIKDGNKIV